METSVAMRASPALRPRICLWKLRPNPRLGLRRRVVVIFVVVSHLFLHKFFGAKVLFWRALCFLLRWTRATGMRTTKRTMRGQASEEQCSEQPPKSVERSGRLGVAVDFGVVCCVVGAGLLPANGAASEKYRLSAISLEDRPAPVWAFAYDEYALEGLHAPSGSGCGRCCGGGGDGRGCRRRSQRRCSPLG